MLESHCEADDSDDTRVTAVWLCLIGWREELVLPEDQPAAVTEPRPRVRVIDEGPLRAFILESPEAPEPAWVDVHHALVSMSAASAAVIPARPGCRFRGISGVRAMLRDHQELLGLALENVAGASEFRVSVRCSGEAEDLPAGRGQVLEAVLAPLQEASRASCRRRLDRPRPAGELARWSFLVSDDAREDFLAAAESASNAMAVIGLELDCSGPGLPEGFVPRVMAA